MPELCPAAARREAPPPPREAPPPHLDPTSPDYVGPQLGPAAQLLLQGGAKKTHNPLVR